MSINNNNLSLECPSHFSITAIDPKIETSESGKSWRLLGTSLSCATPPTKSLSQYSFKIEILERELTSWDYIFPIKFKRSGQIAPLAKEISQLSKEDLYDRKNLLELLRVMSDGDDKEGYALGYRGHGSGTYSKLSLIDLWECSCGYSTRFTKPNFFASRIAFENEFLDVMNEKLSKLMNQKLNILFVGSGGCLSEWKIISQMIFAGFEKLEIYVVDRDYAKESQLEYPKRFQQFFQNFPQVKIDIHILTSLEEFAKEDVSCDIACALDFDADTSKDSKIKLNLSENGFTFVTRNSTSPNWEWNNTDKDRHIISQNA